LENLNHQVDPYIGCGHYCYYCYVLDQSETDWQQEILFHEDLRGRLKKELSKIPPQTIYMGWHTDPYQPCEAEHRQTRQVLELLLDKGFSASLLTKSDLVLRDMDVMHLMNSASVSVSVAFNHDSERRRFEANTTPTEARIAALREIKAKGIRTSALICPVIPYITDVKPLIDQLAPHTDKIWIYGLSMLNNSGPSWQNVAEILDSHYPGKKEQIEAVVFSKEHSYWSQLRQELLILKEKRGLNLMIHV
jgi:DNA repair photolyase